MVHNGIEYGLMAAYAEGLNILQQREHRQAPSTRRTRRRRPLRDPEHYQYDFDLAEVAEVWRRGSVVGSWLLDLTAAARCAKDPELEASRAGVGLGRGPLDDPRRHRRGSPRAGAHRRRCTRASARAASADFADKVLSAMRHAFGGHEEKKS